MRLKTMWAGCAFASDFREERGHAYMLDDQTFTERQQVTRQPGTCMHCHASVYAPHRRLGGGDLIKGFEAMNQMAYAEARKEVAHPVACIDCHDPRTMQLRVTRPGFLEGIRVLKAAQGTPDYDVNRDATRQEMRAFVCGQCHVGTASATRETPHLPLGEGAEGRRDPGVLRGDRLRGLDSRRDGRPHAESAAPRVRNVEPGDSTRSGVACADCHMPFQRVGAMKISDHHVRSPLLNINRACQTCHRWPEEELRQRVHDIQDRTFALRNQAMDVMMELVADLRNARASGVTDAASRRRA